MAADRATVDAELGSLQRDTLRYFLRETNPRNGPIIPMIENCRTGLVWRLMRDCPYVVTGLRRAGFTGGWL